MTKEFKVGDEVLVIPTGKAAIIEEIDTGGLGTYCTLKCGKVYHICHLKNLPVDFKLKENKEKQMANKFKVGDEVIAIRTGKISTVKEITGQYCTLKNGGIHSSIELISNDLAKPPPKKDATNPSYYDRGGIKSMDFLEAYLSPEEFKGFLKGNAMKYLIRAEFKNGDEDYKKANWYTNKLMEKIK